MHPGVPGASDPGRLGEAAGPAGTGQLLQGLGVASRSGHSQTCCTHVPYTPSSHVHQVYGADLVVCAVGVEPATEWMPRRGGRTAVWEVGAWVNRWIEEDAWDTEWVEVDAWVNGLLEVGAQVDWWIEVDAWVNGWGGAGRGRARRGGAPKGRPRQHQVRGATSA